MVAALPEADASAEVAAWWRLVELCLPSHEECGAATFRPEGAETLAAEWDRWVGEVFVPVLVPAWDSIQAAIEARDWSALLEADAALGAALPHGASQGSLQAGRLALLGHVPPRGAKFLERLRELAPEHTAAGHLATVFAVRAHIFHQPSRQTLGALLLAECVQGGAAAGITLPVGRTVDFLQSARREWNRGPSPRLMAV